MAQSSSEPNFSVNVNETNSEHIEAGTLSGNKMDVIKNLLIKSETETNHNACKEYTKAESYYSSLSSAERWKSMRLSAEYEDIICASSIVGKVNFIIEAYNSLLEHNESDTGENKSTRQSIEDLTKHRETHPDFSVQKLRKLFETERPPQMMIASSSRTSRVDYSKSVGKVEKNYGSFETEEVSHGRVSKYLLEMNKYGSTNIESQYNKTLEKNGKKCRCNVHVFSDKSNIETKISHDESSMKTLNEHSELIMIDETAHESNDDMCRKEEMSVSSSSDDPKHLGTNNESQYNKTLEKVVKNCRCNVHVFSDESDIESKMSNDESSIKTLNVHSECKLIDETAHESNNDMCRKEEMSVASSSNDPKHLGTNIESQYNKTLEKGVKNCRCNVHVFSDKSEIESKMSNDESSMKTLNEHSECILIDETAHESNNDMCRKEEMLVSSSSADAKHFGTNIEGYYIESQYHKTLKKVDKKCRCNVPVSMKTFNEHSECILMDKTAHESNDEMCRKEEMSVSLSCDDYKHLDDSTSTGKNCSPKEDCVIKMLEHQVHEGTAQQEIKLEVKIECPKEMEISLREVLDRLSLLSALNPYNYFILGYITTMVLTKQAENLRLLKKSILEECWNLTLAILDKIRRYLVDKLNICQEHLIAYFESLLLSMFITSSEVMNRVTFRK